jgi:hypothetical protein
MTHHNQTKELITWFLNLPLDECFDNKRYKLSSSNSRPHEAQLKENPMKSSRMSSKIRKTIKVSKW